MPRLFLPLVSALAVNRRIATNGAFDFSTREHLALQYVKGESSACSQRVLSNPPALQFQAPLSPRFEGRRGVQAIQIRVDPIRARKRQYRIAPTPSGERLVWGQAEQRSAGRVPATPTLAKKWENRHCANLTASEKTESTACFGAPHKQATRRSFQDHLTPKGTDTPRPSYQFLAL